MEDAYRAYIVDNTVFHFGTALKAELRDVEGKTKQEIRNKQDRILQQWLGLPQKFRSPPGMVGSGAKSDVEQHFVVKGQH